MTHADFQRMILKYKGPFADLPLDVLADLGLLLDTVLAASASATTLKGQVEQQRIELHGARTTMLALCRALGGCIELPHEAVATLHPDDRLHVTDIETPFGTMKRFSFEAHDADRAAPDPARAPIRFPPRTPH